MITIAEYIDECELFAEMDVISSLIDAYEKQAMMMEYMDEDAVSELIYTEGFKDDLNAPILGNKGENIFKRILLFIPRAIATLINRIANKAKGIDKQTAEEAVELTKRAQQKINEKELEEKLAKIDAGEIPDDMPEELKQHVRKMQYMNTRTRPRGPIKGNYQYHEDQSNGFTAAYRACKSGKIHVILTYKEYTERMKNLQQLVVIAESIVEDIPENVHNIDKKSLAKLQKDVSTLEKYRDILKRENAIDLRGKDIEITNLMDGYDEFRRTLDGCNRHTHAIMNSINARVNSMNSNQDEKESDNDVEYKKLLTRVHNALNVCISIHLNAAFAIDNKKIYEAYIKLMKYFASDSTKFARTPASKHNFSNQRASKQANSEQKPDEPDEPNETSGNDDNDDDDWDDDE